jgi:DNA-binding NarL/FixJ family response regulator
MSNPNNKPERLTEQLRRQDLQNRVNNLSEVMEVVSREQRETTDSNRPQQTRWDLLQMDDSTPHSLPIQGIELLPDGRQMLPSQPPQVLRLSPEEQEEYYKTCTEYLKTLESKQEPDKEE